MKKYMMLVTIAVFAMVLVGANASAQDHEYVGADKCKMCHKVQYASWQETTHSKATEHAKASTERTFDASCLKCHATNATEDLPGVQCEACHGAGGDFKKMSIMKDLEAAKANGLMIPDQATCDGCHTGEDHANSKVFADELNNKAAVHEFKNPPGE